MGERAENVRVSTTGMGAWQGEGWAGLQRQASRLRITVVRMLHRAQAGHPGGCLSAAEILTALYFKTMRINPQNPRWEDRDRFILSKGHASAMLYAVLQARGFFDAELLQTYDEIDSMLQAHPDCRTPGVDMPTGSLGQGLSMGVGVALGARLQAKDARVFVLLGDGELQEGQVWEAAMAAPRFGLSNLVAIVDANRVQLTGHVDDVIPVEPLAAKWEAFRWHVLEVDGHDVKAVADACEAAERITDGPTVILAHTIKGKGVSFMEGNHRWHSAPITDEFYEQAMVELGATETEL